MARYRVWFQRVDTSSVEVEADNEEAAEDLAFETAMLPGLCIQCTGWGRDYASVDPGEWELYDDEPVELIADE